MCACRLISDLSLCLFVYLLVLLKLQLNGGLDAVAGVLVGLFESQVHQVFVVRPGKVSTGEDDHVGQDLNTQRIKGQNDVKEAMVVSRYVSVCNFPTITLFPLQLTLLPRKAGQSTHFYTTMSTQRSLK